MKTQIQNFLNTPGGTFVKTSLCMLIGLWVKDVIQANNIFIPLDKQRISDAVILCVIPNLHWILNFLNPKYVQYGVTSVAKQVAKEERQDIADLQALDASMEDKNK